MWVVLFPLYLMSCFNFLLYFWRTRTNLLPEQGYIYAVGVSTFKRLTSMFFRSLVSVLIWGCTTFWRLLVILFLYQLIYHVWLFIFLALCSKKECGIYTFLLISPSQNPPCLLLRPSIFLPPLFPLFYTILWLPFYSLPLPLVPVVWVSISLYFLSLVVGLYSYRVVAFLWGTFLVFCWSFLNPFTYWWFNECGQFCCIFVW